MGKNHRHTKKLKSEKSKIHIKSKTKFLPKGQNVTNTAFKIKPIVLSEQLKERKSPSSLGHKKANIHELISKLKHYNESVKVEACHDLKDVINRQDIEATQIYLSSILQNASALMQDRERKVRRSSTKLLNTILEKVSLSALRPFFNYILTNLKCAMTNINKHIQEDSLLLLDAVLEHKSSLLAENFDKIFPNFLTLISKLKSHSSSERSLSLNLEGKISSVKWRVKVLTRLYGILDALMRSRGVNIKKNTGGEISPFCVNAKGSCFIPIFKDIRVYERANFSPFDTVKEGSEFDAQLSNLTQLLHEIWTEVVPEKTTKKNRGAEPTILTTEESVAVFSCVVNILRLLYDYVQFFGNVQSFSEKSTMFLDHLLRNFPYSHNRKNNFEITKDFSKSFVLNYDQNCLEENLIIVHVFIASRFNSNFKNSPHFKKSPIASYLNDCLKGHYQPNSTSSTYLVKILKEILLKNSKMCQKFGLNEGEIMENVAGFYSGAKIPASCKSDILEILTCSRFAKLESWTVKLPDFLCCKQVSAKLIDAVLDLCRKGETSVQEGVRFSLKSILENLPNMEISETGDVERARMNLISIFFYLPELSPKDILEIHNFIKVHSSLSYSKYLQNMLDLRSIISK